MSLHPSAETAHAHQHPDQPVQETRGRKKGPISDAEKATRALASAARKVAQDALAKDLDAFVTLREDTIRDLMNKHKRTEPYMRSLVMNQTRYPQTRAPSLRTGLIHDLATKAREGQYSQLLQLSYFIYSPVRADGKSLHLLDLQQMADEKIATEVFSEAEKTHLINAVEAQRELKTTGLRGTNIGASVDARSVASNFQDEVSHPSLFFRFFTASHLYAVDQPI
jgi:hypothetical protein